MTDQENRQDPQEGARTAQAWIFGFLAGAAVLGAMGVTYVIGFNQGEDEGGGTVAEKPAAKQETTAEPVAAGPGKELFAASCGSCHTLSAAETSGTTGPNLDDLAPDEQQVLAAIENGGTGAGAMPPGLLQGEEAQQVAAFVSSSAGQ